MSGTSPYRSRLFQHIHHQSVKAVRRAQRAWREITSVAAWGAQAVTYSFSRLWTFVRASHLQMPAVPLQGLLRKSAERSTAQSAAANAPSKAVARVLTFARTIPYLAAPVRAPRLLAVPKHLAVRTPSHPALQNQRTSGHRATVRGSSSLIPQAEGAPAPKKLKIRAIASQIETRQLVLVTPHNAILDCLTDAQKAAIAQRIATELDHLATIPPQTQLVVQPRNWQQSIDRLAFPARQLRQLPETTQRLLQSSVGTWHRLSKPISHRPLAIAFRELAKQIPIPAKVPQLSVQLALPPARKLLQRARSPLANLTSLLGTPSPATTSHAFEPQTALPSIATALSWKNLQQQFQAVWNSAEALTSNHPPSPQWPWKLAAIPFGRTQWATNFLQPFHRHPHRTVNLNGIDRHPVLPPSPPQLLLQPPTIGFLRPSARGSIKLHRIPQSLQTSVGQPARAAQPAGMPLASPGKSSIPSPASAATAVRSPQTASRTRCKRPARNGSSLRSRGKQYQAPVNTYIDVEATDLGSDPTALSRGVDWLDRSVYVIEESALKAWQWWCELVEPEGAPKPVNMTGIPRESRALLAASTHRSQEIAVASAELGVALFQELWPVIWHFMQVLGRRGSKLTYQLLQWLISVAFPIAIDIVSASIRLSVARLWKLLQTIQNSLK